MDTNVRTLDRLARLALGAVLLAGGFAAYGGLVELDFGPVPRILGSVFVALVGVILLVTGYGPMFFL